MTNMYEITLYDKNKNIKKILTFRYYGTAETAGEDWRAKTKGNTYKIHEIDKDQTEIEITF